MNMGYGLQIGSIDYGNTNGLYLNLYRSGVDSLFCLLADALENFAGGNLLVTGPNATASIWATYPTEGISKGIGFFDQASVERYK